MENTADTDIYYTIAAPAEALYKEKGSKFLCYAYPVQDEDRIREHLEALRKRYYDATHHCYAWRLRVPGARRSVPMTTASPPRRQANRFWDNCSRGNRPTR